MRVTTTTSRVFTWCQPHKLCLDLEASMVGPLMPPLSSMLCHSPHKRPIVLSLSHRQAGCAGRGGVQPPHGGGGLAPPFGPAISAGSDAPPPFSLHVLAASHAFKKPRWTVCCSPIPPLMVLHQSYDLSRFPQGLHLKFNLSRLLTSGLLPVDLRTL
jgi:hypothetical protein